MKKYNITKKTIEKFDTDNKLSFVTINENGDLSSIDLKGIIVAWYDTLEKIPSGWAVCDGLNGTPDLRGRIILGAGNGTDLTPRVPNEIGGEEAHILTINELPSHSHKYNVSTNTCMQDCDANNAGGANTMTWPKPSGITSGAGTPHGTHNNMPPYYVLFYIMKL